MLSILPDNVIFEIFKKLPVKSLLLLKELDETWCQIIESPMFIKAHHHHQQSVKRENQTICMVSMERYGRLVGIDACGYDVSVGCTTEKIAHLRNPRGKACFYIGSSNGLICIGVQEYSAYTSIAQRIIIWNPSTRKSNMIEPAEIYSPFATMDNVLTVYEWSACVYGFSYVSSVDDYRVVRICHYQYGRYDPYVEVFSVKTNRWWVISMAGLPIPNDYPLMDDGHQLSQHAVMVNEIMYYKTIEHANDGMELSTKIRCFDLGSECFLQKLVSLPPGLEHWRSDDLRLAELGGVLCCISCTKIIPSRSFEIWQKERGKDDVWSKMISIPFWEWPAKTFIPICLTSHTRWMVKTDENNPGSGECLIVSDGKSLFELEMSTGSREFFYRLPDFAEREFSGKLKGWEDELFLFDEATLISPS